MKTINAGEIDVDLSSAPAPLDAGLLGNADTQLTVDLDLPGKQHGHLTLSATDPSRAPHVVRIPVCIIKGNLDGPVITIMAGLHGDECEGSVTVHKLARTLSADNIRGCLILLPAVNIGGLIQATRINPLDGHNVDYAFPGSATGSPSERLAYEITHRFIARSDLVIDLRSGGSRLRFAPSAAVPFNNDKQQRSDSENTMFAFGAPNSLRIPASAADSCLQGTVRSMNKQYLLVQLGGAMNYTLNTLNIAYTGCLNVLRHNSMLSDQIDLAATRLLEVRDDSYYVYASRAGLYEPLSYLGESVWQAEPMAHLVPVSNTLDTVFDVYPTRNATLIACHPGGHVNDGDLIAILAEEVQG